MAGLRLTLRRFWPSVFNTHPIPWTQTITVADAEFVERHPSVTAGEIVRCLRDADGGVVMLEPLRVPRSVPVINDSRRLYLLLVDLYQYTVATTGGHNRGIWPRVSTQWVPSVLVDNALPWRIAYSIAMPGSMCIRLTDAFGNTIVEMPDAADTVLLVHAVYELSRLAEGVRARQVRRMYTASEVYV
jgi:hypothetical protein